MHIWIQGVSKLTFLIVAAVQRCSFGTERNRLTGPRWSHSDSEDDGPTDRMVRVYTDTCYHIYSTVWINCLKKVWIWRQRIIKCVLKSSLQLNRHFMNKQTFFRKDAISCIILQCKIWTTVYFMTYKSDW